MPTKADETRVLFGVRTDLYLGGEWTPARSGETVAVELVERLRDTVTFTGIEPLVEQMGRDVERCRQVLSVVSPG